MGPREASTSAWTAMAMSPPCARSASKTQRPPSSRDSLPTRRGAAPRCVPLHAGCISALPVVQAPGVCCPACPQSPRVLNPSPARRLSWPLPLQCGEGCVSCLNGNGTCVACDDGLGLIDDECKPCSSECEPPWGGSGLGAASAGGAAVLNLLRRCPPLLQASWARAARAATATWSAAPGPPLAFLWMQRQAGRLPATCPRARAAPAPPSAPPAATATVWTRRAASVWRCVEVGAGSRSRRRGDGVQPCMPTSHSPHPTRHPPTRLAPAVPPRGLHRVWA